MSFLRTRRFNVEAVLKILLLGGFAYFFSQTLISGRALLYVNPKIIPFVKFGILAMCLMMVITLPEVFKIPRKKLRLIPYTLFFIPLLLSAVFPAVALDSTSLAGRSVDMGAPGMAQDADTIPSHGDILPGLDQAEGPLLPFGSKVVVDESNFMVWLTALYQQPEEHAGLELEIDGFVYKNEDLEPQTFMLARFIMVCCTADMQLAGLVARYAHTEALEVDTWLRVNGTLTVEMFNDRPIPALVVEQITEIEKPQIPYVFP